MAAPKLVLFDIDDTLIDHSSAARAGATSLYTALPQPMPLAGFLTAWHDATRQHFSRYLSGETTYQEQRRGRIRQTIAARLSDYDAGQLFEEYYRVYSAHSVIGGLRELADLLSNVSTA